MAIIGMLKMLCFALSLQSATLADMPDVYRKGGGFEPDSTVVYKTLPDAELRLDVFYPADFDANSLRPAVVFFFGGGWINGDPRQFYTQAKYLTRRGLVAVCADYRTESSHSVQPFECVEDAKSAMRYVRSHAAELGIDSNRLAAAGGSAGGHLAAATAVVTAFNSPEDDLSVSPVPDLLILFNPACDNSEEGYGYDRVSEYWEEFSPMEHLDGEVPPTIIFLGSLDGVFPPERAQLYKERMEASGNLCELLIYENQRHGFFNLYRKKNGFDPENNKKYFLETVEQMDRFLVRFGFLSGEPTVEEWFAEQEAL